jgi:hypothetical protein
MEVYVIIHLKGWTLTSYSYLNVQFYTFLVCLHFYTYKVSLKVTSNKGNMLLLDDVINYFSNNKRCVDAV